VNPFPRTSQMSDSQFSAFIAAHPVSGGKDDSLISQQEAQQNGFNKQLATLFTSTFGKQSAVLNFLTDKLTAQVNNPTGMSPEQLATLRTENTESAAKSFAAAQTATQSIEAGRGGSSLPSGVSEQLTGENANAAATAKAAGDTNINLADAELKQKNYWNAVSGLDEVSSMENPTGYGSLYNQGSSNVGTLGEEYNQTTQNPLWSTLGGVAGAGITAIGNYYGSKRGA
jgi:hypothetical protein